MDVWLSVVLTSLASILASSGFWAYLQKKDSKRTAVHRLLLGLAYDKIVTLGLQYIERGWISKDEYEHLRNYVYEPYLQLGGNGVAERVMAEVKELPLHSSRSRYYKIARDRRTGREGNNAA